MVYQKETAMYANISANRPNHHKTKLKPSSMGSVIHEKSPLSPKKPPRPLNEAQVISIFGEGERRRANYARKLTEEFEFKKDKVAFVDFSKVNDPGFYLKLEQRKQKHLAIDCVERKKLESRLRVALVADEWFNKPVQALSLEERAKMLLLLDLCEAPDAIIINRPTLVRQFNRKLRALQQVFRRTYVVTDTLWNFSLAATSDRIFEVGKGAPKETFLEF